MRALVCQAPGLVSWDNVPDPRIERPTDASLRVHATTVGSCDVRILHGLERDVAPGTVLGHEGVGEVVEVGRAVRSLARGDHVIVSPVAACGHCTWCRTGRYSGCPEGGRILGRRAAGTQAEYVRVPHADHSTHPWPSSLTPEEAVLLSEVLPTAFEAGVRAGGVAAGDTLVVGAGPVGLAAVLLSRVCSPSRVVVGDLSRPRRDAAVRVGADEAQPPGAVIAEIAEGPGADVVIEAAGTSESFLLGTRLVRRGGTLAVVAAHRTATPLHLESLWDRNLTIHLGQVDTCSVPWLVDLVASGRLDVAGLVTGTRPMVRLPDLYDAFARGPETGDLKLVAARRAKPPEHRRPRSAHALDGTPSLPGPVGPPGRAGVPERPLPSHAARREPGNGSGR